VALAGAGRLPDPFERAVTVSELARHLPVAERLHALALVRAIADRGNRAYGLAAIAPHLLEHLEDAVLDEAVTVARGIENAEDRARALAGLAASLSEEEGQTVAAEALAAAAGDELLWARVLLWAGKFLAPPVRAAAWPRALQLTLPEARAEALAALAADANEPDRRAGMHAALEAVAHVGEAWTRVALLGRLARHFDAAEQTSALALARGLADGWARADALSSLARHLPPDEQAPVLREALAAARTCVEAWPRARALTTVAARWPG
jgi:hypothetical protein